MRDSGIIFGFLEGPGELITGIEALETRGMGVIYIE